MKKPLNMKVVGSHGWYDSIMIVSTHVVITWYHGEIKEKNSYIISWIDLQEYNGKTNKNFRQVWKYTPVYPV